jgi:hypothetical protein
MKKWLLIISHKGVSSPSRDLALNFRQEYVLQNIALGGGWIDRLSNERCFSGSLVNSLVDDPSLAGLFLVSGRGFTDNSYVSKKKAFERHD